MSKRTERITKTGVYRNTTVTIENAGPADFAAMFDQRTPFQAKAKRLAEFIIKTKSHAESLARADQAQREARSLLHHLEALETARCPCLGEEKQDTVAKLAYQIGLLHERLAIRFLERFTQTGKVVSENARRRQERGHGTRESKEREWAGWQRHVDGLVLNKGLTFRRACKLTAERVGKNPDTIKKRTIDPRKTA